MKDITRIHIAKTAYDIELAAKKELEKYITGLEKYTENQEVLDDIEIRITELLFEQNVSAGGVIAKTDVEAIRERLGEPSDFAPENADSMTTPTTRSQDEGKRVYRDTDNAFVGGVLAGIARYFGIDSLWIRLIFIVLLVPSAGTFVLLYAILWLIIPPSKTAAQKLQAIGKPVTLESIKAFAEDERVNQAAHTTRTILRYICGVASLLLGLGVLIATGFVSVGIFGIGYEGSHFVGADELSTWWFVVAIALFTVAGLLLSALLFVLSGALFQKIWNKRTTTVVVSVIAAGLVTFALGIGTMIYGSWQENIKIEQMQTITKANLPASFDKMSGLNISNQGDDVSVEYIVTNTTTPYYELSATKGTIKPKFRLNDDKKTADLQIMHLTDRPQVRGDARLTIYGPALDALSIDLGQVDYSNESEQAEIHLTGSSGSIVLNGTYNTVFAKGSQNASIELDGATIKDLNVQLLAATVSAGTVRNLTVDQPEACPANDEADTIVTVQSVSSGKISYNDSELSARTIKRDCGSVVINKDKNWED